MPTFTYSFTVDAPQAAVANFHHDTSVLKRLTPLPLVVQIHEFEPLGEGSEARFTIWAGPIPLRWHVVHRDVGPAGFTDSQLSGPLKGWTHQHRFTPLGDGRTRVDERIVYEYDRGWRGILSRALFSAAGLRALFKARSLLTRRYVAQEMARAATSPQA